MSQFITDKISGVSVPDTGSKIVIEPDGSFNFDSNTLRVDAINNKVIINNLSDSNYNISVSSSTSTKLSLPRWENDSGRPINPEVGLIGYHESSKSTEVYTGTEWIVWGDGPAESTTSAEVPADTGSGGGWSVGQGADASNVVGFTTTSMTQHIDSWYNSAGATNLPLSYTCSGSFHFHTGHNGNSTQWPMYFAINVSSFQKGKVLNQIQWLKHGNACGNVDIFGSNLAINSATYRTESNYTFLGRTNMGGFGSASDCNVSTQSFNTNSYGYSWYMIKIVDISGSISYPGVGTLGGWAMYGMRLNKV